MKKKWIAACLFPLVLGLTACSNEAEVADVSLGLFTFKNIKVESFVDPLVPGVTCHVADVEEDFAFADPSDSSVSCRQTGPITRDMIEQVAKDKNGDVVFAKSKSIFFKSIKIRRIFDEKSQTLLYVSYSTKETSGSTKHSLSTIPLWGTPAYRDPLLPTRTAQNSNG